MPATDSTTPTIRLKAAVAAGAVLAALGVVPHTAGQAQATTLPSCEGVNSEVAYHNCLEDIDAAGNAAGPFEIVLTDDIVLTDTYSPVHRYRLTPELTISAAEGTEVVVSTDPGNTGDTAFLNIWQDTTVTIEDVSFVGVTTHFGALRASHATVVLVNVTVDDVTATGTAGPGLINNSNGSVHIYDSHVANSSGGPGAGVITMRGTGPLPGREFRFVNSHATGNSFGSPTAGGSAVATVSDAVVTVEDSTFEASLSPDGGALRLIDSDVTITRSTFSDNDAVYSGGALHLVDSTADISLSTFEANHAGTSGGAIYATGTELTVSNSAFTSNTSDGSGGAVAGSTSGFMSFKSTAFTANVSGSQGGAIHALIPTSVALGSTFQSNEASLGGAIRVSNDFTTVTDSSFYGNGRDEGLTSSGGVFSISSTGDVHVERSEFLFNQGDYGGVANVADGGTFTAERSLFYGNTGHTSGHLFYASGYGAIVNVDHSTMTENMNGSGPAIYMWRASVNLTFVTIVDTVDPDSSLGFIFPASSEGNLFMSQSAIEMTGGDICGSASGATLTSGGYNWLTDATCVPVLGAGDVTNGTSLGLLDLDRNGGRTLTMAPTASSPIVDMLPWGNVGCNGASEFYDQRGMYRPFGGIGEDCTIGAVEYTPEWSLELDVVFRDAPFAQVGTTVEFDVEATNTGLLPLTELAVTSDDIPGLACAMDDLGIPEAELWIAPDDTLTLVCDGAELELTSAHFDSDPATLSLHVTADSAEQAGEIDDQGSFEIPLDREAALDLSIDASVTLVEAVASTIPVTVTNTGNVTVDVTLDQTPAAATWDGACAGEFTLGAGDEQQCTLTYTPTSADGDAGEVHVTVSATGDPAVGGTIGASDGPVAITVEAAGFEAPTTPSFSDVGLTHPFFEEIEWLAWKGVTGGYNDGTFRPGAPVSRQAMAAFLYRFAGEPEFEAPATASFPDVPTTHPFFEEIEWLAAEGVTGGYGDGTFRPGAAVSRQAMAAFLYRFQGEPAFTPPATASFPDVPTSHPFYAEIEWLVDVNITTGYNDGTFRGGASVSRQAMAAFLQRLDAL